MAWSCINSSQQQSPVRVNCLIREPADLTPHRPTVSTIGWEAHHHGPTFWGQSACELVKLSQARFEFGNGGFYDLVGRWPVRNVVLPATGANFTFRVPVMEGPYVFRCSYRWTASRIQLVTACSRCSQFLNPWSSLPKVVTVARLREIN